MGQVGLVGRTDQGQNPEGTKDVATLEVDAESWTNFSLQDEPWAEFSTLEVAACIILCTYGPV